MTHIELYSHLFVVKKQLENFQLQDNTIHPILHIHFQETTKLQIEENEFIRSLDREPTHTQLVKALSELGFSNKHIASLLNTTPNAVAVYKVQKSSNHYRNRWWTKLYSKSWSLEPTNPFYNDYNFPDNYQAT